MIITYPDPLLDRAAAPVRKVDAEVRALMEDMAETMYAQQGVGLAAPQVSVSLRVIVVDVGQEKGKAGLIKMANPEIVERDGEIEWEEGCLSVPEFRIVIKRSNIIKVRYVDEKNERREIVCGGIEAVAIQHEMDHLDGKLIIECASRLKKQLYLRKVQKKKKQEKAF